MTEGGGFSFPPLSDLSGPGNLSPLVRVRWVIGFTDSTEDQMKLRQKLFLWGCLAAFAFSHHAPSSAAGISQASKPSSKLQVLSWSWSDTNQRGDRQFAEDDYWSVDELPVIEFTISPTIPSRRVLLEKFNDSNQSWEIVAEDRTDARGGAVLFVSPDCREISDYGNPWCDYSETLRFRVLKALGQKQRISQTFEVTYESTDDDWSSDSDDDSDESDV